MPKKSLILVVDDELMILEQVALTLEEAGYDVITAREGQEALDRIEKLQELEERKPDLVLLDILMPSGLGGERTATLLRNRYPPGELAIIMMTKPAIESEARMLKIVDDFVNKYTWSMEVLLARIKLRLPKEKTAKKFLSGELEVDLDFCQAKLRGQVLDLSQLNVKVLTYLMQQAYKDVHLRKILENVWPDTGRASEQKVRIAISRIRDALQDYEKYLVTGRGEGTYRWVKEVTAVE